MSRDYLAALRAGPPKVPARGPDKADKSPSVGSVSSEGGRFSGNESAADRCELLQERAAIIEFEAGLPRAAAERLAGFVRCVDCDHWRPSGAQQHGACAAHAAGAAGLWGTDPRGCAAYLAAALAAAVRAMGQRWGYATDELDEALTRARAAPDEWRRLIEADLQGRRWPGGEGWI